MKNLLQVWFSHEQQPEYCCSNSSSRTLRPFWPESDWTSDHAEAAAHQDGVQDHGVQTGRAGQVESEPAATTSTVV